MKEIQFIGHRPTIKQASGERTVYKDIQALCHDLKKLPKTEVMQMKGIQLLPKFYLDYVGIDLAEPTADHIVQLTPGGLS